MRGDMAPRAKRGVAATCGLATVVLASAAVVPVQGCKEDIPVQGAGGRRRSGERSRPGPTEHLRYPDICRETVRCLEDMAALAPVMREAVFESAKNIRRIVSAGHGQMAIKTCRRILDGWKAKARGRPEMFPKTCGGTVDARQKGGELSRLGGKCDAALRCCDELAALISHFGGICGEFRKARVHLGVTVCPNCVGVMKKGVEAVRKLGKAVPAACSGL